MPRRNKLKIISGRRNQPTTESNKMRYTTKRAAQQAATEAAKYHLDLRLSVYQSPGDGGWYLTSRREEQ